MTEKELKKLNRYQLLELLIIQMERADSLQAQVEELEKKLNERELRITSLGSIAEAALQLKGVFTAAQEAADLYLAAAKERADAIELAAEIRAERLLAQAQTRSTEDECPPNGMQYGKTD